MSSQDTLDDVLAQLSSYAGTLRGASNEDVTAWLNHVSNMPRTEEGVHQQWIQGALELLSAEMKGAMKEDIERRDHELSFNPEWSLDKQLRGYFEDKDEEGYQEFVETLMRIHDRMRVDSDLAVDSEIENSAPEVTNPPIAVHDLSLEDLQEAIRATKDRAAQLVAENPRLAKAGGIALMVGGGVVIVPAATAAVLLAAGFGPLGPIAGTLAPLIQSVFYGAQTGGLFSMLQAAGMTIVAPAPIATGLATVGATIGAWLGFGNRPRAPAAAGGSGNTPSSPDDKDGLPQ